MDSITLDDAYRSYAEALNRGVDTLTEAEKANAYVVAIMEQIERHWHYALLVWLSIPSGWCDG